MSFKYNIENKNEYLLVTANGTLSSLEKAMNYVVDIINHCKFKSTKFISLDERMLDHQIPVLKLLNLLKKVQS